MAVLCHQRLKKYDWRPNEYSSTHVQSTLYQRLIDYRSFNLMFGICILLTDMKTCRNDLWSVINSFCLSGVSVLPCSTGLSASRPNTALVARATPGSLPSCLASRATSPWSSSLSRQTGCSSTTGRSATPTRGSGRTSSPSVSSKLLEQREVQCVAKEVARLLLMPVDTLNEYWRPMSVL